MSLPEGTRIRGRFQPRQTDDLKPGVTKLIGQVIECVSDGMISPGLAALDGSPYGGEYYFCPVGRWFDSGHDWWWMPSGDFQDIEVVA